MSTVKEADPRAHTGPMSEKSPFVAERKKLYIPFVTANALLETTAAAATSTLALAGAGSSGHKEISSFDVVGMDLDATDEYFSAHIPVPDDMDIAEDLWVYLIVAPEDVGSGDKFTYTITYTATAITAYDNASAATQTGEAFTAAATAMDTALTETISTEYMTRYAPYRGKKGIISGNKLAQDDFMSFRTTLAGTASSAAMTALGLEFYYVQRKL